MYFIILFLFCCFVNPVFAQEAPIVKSLNDASEEIEIFSNVDAEFFEWLDDFKKKAIKKYDIKPEIVNKAFKNIKYEKKVIHADRKQPEFLKTFWVYYDSALKPERVANGKIKLKEHAKLLDDVYKKFNVQPHILLAFWGMETNYGTILGKYNVIHALATLSFDQRRSKFFTNELIKALQIVNEGHIDSSKFIGSWAGAFGNFQFIPSTFVAYAIDGNGDGKIDLINSFEDALYSAANYLSKMGWNGKYRWGRPVMISKNNKKAWEYVNSNDWESVKFFSSIGVKTYTGGKLPNTDIKAMLIAPDGIYGPVFMVYENFKYIMRWNASTNYALSIGLLADAISSNSMPVFERPSNWDSFKPMNNLQLKEIQKALKDLDIYDSSITGIYGKKTMKAIKKYQNMLLDGDEKVSKDGKEITTYKSGKPVISDGYPSMDLYEMLVK